MTFFQKNKAAKSRNVSRRSLLRRELPLVWMMRFFVSNSNHNFVLRSSLHYRNERAVFSIFPVLTSALSELLFVP
jgi:hypothetical protein